MDFSLTEDQKLLQESACRFAQAELLRVAKELEQSAHPLPDTWRKRYAEKGLLGINSPSEYGGASRRAARLGGVRAHFRFGCLSGLRMLRGPRAHHRALWLARAQGLRADEAARLLIYRAAAIFRPCRNPAGKMFRERNDP